MKIEVQGLPVAGREIKLGLTEPWAVEAARISLDAEPSRLHGKVFLKRATKGQSSTDVVVVDLAAEASAPATCDRCGEATEIVVRSDTRLLYAPEESHGSSYDGLRLDVDSENDEIELTPEDLDVGWYRENVLNLADVLCEALSLERSVRVVCADVRECDKRTDALLATARVVDGPFAVLGALKRPTAAGSAEED